MSGILEDNWILISVSASNLLGYVVLVEVEEYEENPAPHRYRVGKKAALS